MDAIVLKALVKDPDYRYQSADEMRADIEAYLDGQPVAATAALGAVGYGNGYDGYNNGYGNDQPTTALRPGRPGGGGQTSMLPPVNPDDGGYGYDDRPDRRRQNQKKSHTSTILLVLAGVLVLVGAILIGKSVFSGKRRQHHGERAPARRQQPGRRGEAGDQRRRQDVRGQERAVRGPAQGQHLQPGPGQRHHEEGRDRLGHRLHGRAQDRGPGRHAEGQGQRHPAPPEQGLPGEDQGGRVQLDAGHGRLSRTRQGGSQAEKNSTVTLTIAKKQTTKLPDVTGRTTRRRSSSSAPLGFTNVSRQDVDSDKPLNQVVSMTPTGNTRQAKDVQIVLKVSKGPQQTPPRRRRRQMPQGLVGQTVKKATQMLNDAGFSNIQFAQGSSNDDKARVMIVTPGSGTTVDPNQPITLTTIGGGGGGPNLRRSRST